MLSIVNIIETILGYEQVIIKDVTIELDRQGAMALFILR